MFSVDIRKHIGNLGTRKPNGYRKEVNLVSWGGQEAKIDIREWNVTRKSMSRGVSLTIDEARALVEALNAYFEKEEK